MHLCLLHRNRLPYCSVLQQPLSVLIAHSRDTASMEYGIFSGTVLEDDDTVEVPCYMSDNCDSTSTLRPMTRCECCVVSSGLSYFGVSGCTLCVGRYIKILS